MGDALICSEMSTSRTELTSYSLVAAFRDAARGHCVEIEISKMKQEASQEISVQVKDETESIQPVNEERKELDDVETKRDRK